MLPSPIRVNADISNGTLTLTFNGKNPAAKVQQWLNAFGAIQAAPDLLSHAEQLAAYHRRYRTKNLYPLVCELEYVIALARGIETAKSEQS